MKIFIYYSSISNGIFQELQVIIINYNNIIIIQVFLQTDKWLICISNMPTKQVMKSNVLHPQEIAYLVP